MLDKCEILSSLLHNNSQILASVYQIMFLLKHDFLIYLVLDALIVCMDLLQKETM